MTELDDELRHVLRRKEPPAGFGERVLRRVAVGPRAERQIPRRQPFVRWAAAAVLLVALVAGVQYRAMQQRREERARGEAAKEQVIQALRLAGSKLQLVQAKIKGIGS